MIPPQKWVSPAQARARRGLQPENSSASIGEAPGGLSALPLRSVLQAAGAKANQAGLLLSWAQPDAHTTNASAAWFFVVQSLSPCLTLCNPMDCSTQASLSLTISQSLLKLMSIELVMPSNHLIPCQLGSTFSFFHGTKLSLKKIKPLVLEPV